MTDARHTGGSAGSSRRLRIGDLDVDTGTREIVRDGEPIDVPKLSYELLIALAEAAPNVVTQDELVARVWPGRVVSPETVTQRVRLLRRALGDDAHEPRYIGLARGAGYRLLCPVVELAASDPSLRPESTTFETRPQSRARALSLAAVAASGLLLYLGVQLLAPEPLPANAVAVLPFANATGNPADSFVSEGLADELRDQLGRVDGLQVSARTSSLAFRSAPADARTIARRLGVRWLIDGTLREQDGVFHVSVQIVDGATGFEVSSSRFERALPELLAIQQDIATRVVADIAAETGDELVASAPATVSVSALELLMLARELEREVRESTARVDIAKLERVIELYRNATRLDPDSAPAQRRLAGALLYLGDVEGAEAPLREALRLDPGSSEVQYMLGLHGWRQLDMNAGAAFERAVELNPNNVDAIWELAKWRWQHEHDVGRTGELFRQGLTLDPLSLSRYADIGNYYGLMGMPGQALEVAARVEELFPAPDGHLVLARIYEVAGDLDEAIAWAARAHIEDPALREAAWYLAELYARIGDEASARRFEPEPSVGQLFFTRRYGELIDLAEERMIDLPGDMKLRYLLAFAYNVEGRHAGAVSLLRRSGLPDSVTTSSRRADAVQALVTFADALLHAGAQDEGRAHAERIVQLMQRAIDSGGQDSWWPHLFTACALASLERDAEALGHLARLPGIRGLAWYPVLKDAPCFRRLAGEEPYESIVAAVEARREALRERVSLTLQRHGLLETVAAR